MLSETSQSAQLLKDALVDLIGDETFDVGLADSLLKQLRLVCDFYVYQEEEPVGGYDFDLLSYACVLGGVDAVKWVIANQVMGPVNLNIALYTAVALAEDITDELVLRYLLEHHGISFEEVCFGDLEVDRQNLVTGYFPDYLTD